MALQMQHDAPRGRGNGRGRGRGGNRQTPKADVAKVTKAKMGPSRVLDAEWVKESLLKGDSFIINVGAGLAGDQQWTFHHPIGETPLSAGMWVCTPSRDISFLLQRKESEELVSWKRRAELAKRQAVLTARTGRGLDGQTEVWTFDGAPAIGPTIQALMAAAKAADPKRESEWLDHATPAVQQAERTFKEALRTQAIPEAWLRVNPKPAYETMGGPLGDVRQTAVAYLGEASFSSARDKVLKRALGVVTE
ncbi:MAG: hypothetical protein [Sclerotinia sclerotiorum narnavirus 2]|nr:MAG: hypothetical protein [Sclerotinia sclerotiorum narnavirus 2]